MNNFLIGIAARTYMASGGTMIKPLTDDTSLRDLERRVSRTKTLDGGCVITDGGVSAGDRTFTIAVESSKTLWDLLKGIFDDSTWVSVSTDEGCYLAKMQRLVEKSGKITMTILLSSDLTEE